jgi:N-acetylneuraminate synthase
MARVQLSNNRFIEDFAEPYIIAEINTSHFGRYELAVKMIDEARRIGVNCVKFQSWSESSLYSQTYYDKNPIAKRFIKKFSMNSTELLALATYCKEIGIDFASTPYSIPEVDFLVDICKVPFIKVASMDINNEPFLRYLAQKKTPIVLSTGMSTIAEIRFAVKTIVASGNNDIIILHCVSLYPTTPNDIHLKNIIGLRDEFPSFPIGFSDHSIGPEIAIASVAFGAAIIEKHFTLDRTIIGMDNQMAMEVDDMRFLINSCRNVNIALGSTKRILSNPEIEQRSTMRRSAVAASNLLSGHILQYSDVDFKRPGTGISPSALESIVGRRLNRNIAIDTVFTNDDFA